MNAINVMVHYLCVKTTQTKKPINASLYTGRRNDEREGRKMSEWISVKDRLPKHNEEILGFEKLIFFGWYDNKFGFLDVVEECHRGQTTHWMPLPNPPQEFIK